MQTKASILIVDDDQSTRRTLEIVFRRQGYAVETASTGREALQMAEGTTFDIALLDLRLPDMDGIELLRPLKALHPQMDLIIGTGYGSMHSAVRALNDGASAYITKPVDMDQVLSQVQSLLERQELVATNLRVEKALRESEARYRQLFEHVPVGLYRATAEGELLDANPAFMQMLACRDRDGLKTIDANTLFTETNDQAPWRTLLGRGGVLRDHPVTLHRMHGSTLEGLLATQATRDAEGHPILYEGSLIDITELVRAREEQGALRNQLLHSQKMEAIGELAAGLAHDFNNVLTAARLGIDLAMMDLQPDGEANGNLTLAINSLQQGADLARQLLLFSRRSPGNRALVHLNAVVQEQMAMLRRLIGEQITITAHLAPDLWPLLGDQAQLGQVILNLVLNARDAMPEGGTLALRTQNRVLSASTSQSHPGARPGRVLCLSVQDSGMGMPADIIDRIFEPFFTTKAKGQGSGLGLAVVYGVVRDHEGWIDVESSPGQGSTFTIYLPGSDAAQAIESATPEGTARRQAQGERILLVKDDDALRQATHIVLSDHGYRVSIAGSVSEALALYEREHRGFQLVFCDATLPDGHGLELARTLARCAPHLPIVLAVGHMDDGANDGGCHAEGVRLLRKPYSLPQLLAIIAQVLADSDPPSTDR